MTRIQLILIACRYHDDAAMASYMLYKENKTGVLSSFPFGAFGFARLDERLKDDPLWSQAKTKPGRDPMGLTKKQPNVEFFSTEASDFLVDLCDPSDGDSCMEARNSTLTSPSVSCIASKSVTE